MNRAPTGIRFLVAAAPRNDRSADDPQNEKIKGLHQEILHTLIIPSFLPPR